MSNLSRLASDHQQKRVALSERVGRQATRLWRTVQHGQIEAGWERIAPDLERVVTTGQLVAAKQSTGYVNGALREQGASPRGGVIVPQAFTGATLEGRGIAPELYTAATTTKRLIGAGVAVGAAFQAGAGLMFLLASTIVRDAGVMADKVAGVGKGSVLMARMVSPGACSRCAILAGVGHFTRHFERHPGCRCTTVPIRSADSPLPDGLFSSPADYFESLTRKEQDRVFTKAGAEAIRLGADPISVVNARRGMFRNQQPGSMVSRAARRTLVGPDGEPFTAYVTVENRRRFGSPYRVDGSRRTSMVRLMPETILDLADGDQARAIELLREYGYMR